MAKEHSQQHATNFHVRTATVKDVPTLTQLFFASFSAPFWKVLVPPTPSSETWWSEAWRMGIEEDPTAHTLVVEYPDRDNNIVAFARWIAPQQNGDLNRKWPNVTAEGGWDMAIAEPFFGGMEKNREHLMGSRPHWFLELLGTDPEYQRQGLGALLVKWGCDRSDKQGLESYLDASEKGRPFYREHHGFEDRAVVELPKRPETYGEFLYRKKPER
ncbi:hypothetical protein LTR66_007375 [Elasticomyces elasticus]|nr:hypothetical protein LTR66_007375 [Elasticomyces elasticus]